MNKTPYLNEVHKQLSAEDSTTQSIPIRVLIIVSLANIDINITKVISGIRSNQTVVAFFSISSSHHHKIYKQMSPDPRLNV